MENAERLLITTFLSIKEIAFADGAKHVSSFVHAFKAWSGLTPSEYRTRNGRGVRFGRSCVNSE